MTSFQKTIKYLATAFAVFLIVSIFGGILSAVGLFADSETKNISNELTEYTVSEEITSLELDINAADLTILKTAETFSVKSNLKNLTVTENNGVLVIKDTQKLVKSYNGAVLTLYLPENYVFDKANISTGAGRLTVDTLSADKLYLKLGAGEVTFNSLTADRKAEIDGGAGKITINDGALSNLEFDMGVGEVTLHSALSGDCEIASGIGKTELVLIGTEDDYRIEIDKGIGNASVNGENMRDGGVYGNGKNEIEIDGGIGEIDISFKEN